MFINQILTKLKSLVYSKSETDSLLNGKASSSHTHTKSQITDFPSLAIVATSGSYNDLSNKPTIRNDILHYAAVSSLDADTISEDGIWYVAGAITGAPMVHHGAFLNVRAVGTPFQMYFPDDLLYVYKRTYSSGAWSSWEKMNARSWDDIQSKPTIPTNTSQLTNDSDFITSSGSCNYANSAGSATTAATVYATADEGGTKELIRGEMSGWDSCWIRCGGASDAGYLEIATADNGNEPIYVRQYNYDGPVTRTLTLLNGSGNTEFPGTVTAPTFSGNLNGNCSGTAGGVAWGNVSGRPTAVSQFSNDSGFITSSGSCNYATTAGAVSTSVAEDSTKDLVYATMADNDYCHISCGGSDDAGYLEIATGDGASEPIYVRQYHWDGSLRTLTLLDENGNTQFPGTVYVPTSIVNSSDSRLKNSVTNIDDALLDAWENIEPKQYKFNDATEEKGDKARYHTGYLAQDIQTECEKQGVNASDYGLFCYDEWDEQEEISEEIEKEKDGKIVKEKRIIRPKREKGDRYSLRYAEALVVECKYLRRENSRLKENLASIEERLEKLEKAENS